MPSGAVFPVPAPKFIEEHSMITAPHLIATNAFGITTQRDVVSMKCNSATHSSSLYAGATIEISFFMFVISNA